MIKQFLQKVGLGQKKTRPVGDTLESGADNSVWENRKNWIGKGLIFIALSTIAIFAFEDNHPAESGVEVGEKWPFEDLYAPFDFAIFKTEEELDLERHNVRLYEPPIFFEHPDPNQKTRTLSDSLQTAYSSAFQAYVNWQTKKNRNDLSGAEDDSVKTLQWKRRLQGNLTITQWSYLRNSYADRMPGVTATRRVSTQPVLHAELLANARQFTRNLITEYKERIYDVPADSILSTEIHIHDEKGHSIQKVAKRVCVPLTFARQYAERHFRRLYPGKKDTVAIGIKFFEAVFTTPLIYQAALSENKWREAESNISVTHNKVNSGQLIIQANETVTIETKAKLVSLMESLERRANTAYAAQNKIGRFLIVILAFALFFLYLYILRRDIFDSNRMLLLIAIIIGFELGLMALAVRLPFISGLIVPISMASILLTVLFDSRVGVFATMTLSILAGVIFGGYNFELSTTILAGGIIGAFSVRDIKNRAQFFISAGLIAGTYFMVDTAFALMSIQPQWMTLLLNDTLEIGANVLFVLFAYPLLFVFEKSFKITTDITLLELSDTNRPLLKELSINAPGTFNHSLQVANLAEAAASAIGANGLLVRVGALYHDIGKMSKPTYFVENQMGTNPHDKLVPHMSALIITSHVKDGLERARQESLPEDVIRFIPEHHGTTRVEYFYRKALENAENDGTNVSEIEFRYPGPVPGTRETGILMLADSVEAASKSIKNPTYNRLEGIVDSIFAARIKDNQLDNCPLTFQDLRMIKNVFLTVLSGMYHVRVKYPGQEEIDPSSEKKKPAKKEKGAVPLADNDRNNPTKKDKKEPKIKKETAEQPDEQALKLPSSPAEPTTDKSDQKNSPSKKDKPKSEATHKDEFSGSDSPTTEERSSLG